ncbi:MAG: hypothetical protein AAF620_19360 [Bacteroidota bacterium]
MKAIKLNIIEPWEFGTDKGVTASIVGENNGQYLIRLSNPMKLQDNEAKYFLAELRDRHSNDNLNKPGKYLLNMVYSQRINEINFKEHKISDFRSGLLVGEAILN